MSGLLIAAPSSGSGKTTITLGLLRALRRRKAELIVGKAGPDYIDPAFHAFASGVPCLNYDPWAMRPELLRSQSESRSNPEGAFIIEAMMGLYDGASNGTGSPADLAVLLNLNIVLVVDCARMSHSLAAVVHGFSTFRNDVKVMGIILNKVGSDRHEAMLRRSLDGSKIPVLGALRSDTKLVLPERHLGLIQAGEHHGLESFVEHAADCVEAGCDVQRLLDLAKGHVPAVGKPVSSLPPLGQKIAVARDTSFAFAYPHLLNSWVRQGATISYFSPLADEPPAADADAIFLPGGYPELHAGQLAGNQHFRSGMVAAQDAGKRIYGECGGYMVLGDAIIASNGDKHEMLGLLPLVTSFQQRKRHLGYRKVSPLTGSFFGSRMTAHEFHYSTVVFEGDAERLFDVKDAEGDSLGQAGLRRGHVAGSYIHLIDLAGDHS